MGHPGPRQDLDAAWKALEFAVRASVLARTAAEHAAKAAAIEEQMVLRGSSAAERHRRMAAIHRRSERSQRAAERMHAALARNMERWLAPAVDGSGDCPHLMGAVASTCGWKSATLTLYSRDGVERLVAASDPTARRAHELEVTLAEGPSWDALHNGDATTRQGAQLERRWPQYGPAVGRLGVHAVAAAPLDLDVDRLRGALTVVGDVAPSPSQAGFGLSDIADALTRTVLRAPEIVHPDSRGLPSLELFGDEDFQPALHQAAGVLHERCGWTIDNAIELIRAHAYAEERSVGEVAEEVVRGGLLLP